MEENRKRHEIINAPYNPVTGLGAVGERKKISIKDSPIGDMYLPVELIKENLFIRRLAKYGFKGYIIRFIKEVEYSEEALNQLWIEFIKYRIIYDFEYWAYSFIFIKDKVSPKDIPFKLNRAQRRVLLEFNL